MKTAQKFGRPDRHGLHQTGGLTIEKFAKVKSAHIDKQRLAQKQRLTRIKRAKQYNKVKKKLIQEGKYVQQPSIPSLYDGDQQGPSAQQPHAQRATSGKHASTPSSTPAADGAQHLPRPHHHQQAAPTQQPADEPLSPPAASPQQPGHKSRKQKQKKSGLQVLAEKRAKKQQEVSQKQEEARKAAKERQAAREAAERKRKRQTVKLFKKTKKGQPLMKYRLEKILDTLTTS